MQHGSAMFMTATAILIGGCGDPTDPVDVDAPLPVIDAPPAIDAAEPPPATLDCTAANPACPELVIAGDAPAPGPVRGYADPSMRRDPASGRLWLAYSWPARQAIASGGSAVTVDSHLAHSDDDGASWTFDAGMWLATPGTSPVTGDDGFFNQETVALAIAPGGGWFSARLHYFTDADGPQVSSFQIRVATATSPTLLAAAPEVSLGGDLSAPQWGTDHNLAALSPELAGCTWNDPGVIVDAGTLYLALECQLFTTGGELEDDEFIAVFSTTPTGAVIDWTWTYRGTLSNHADAVELGGRNLLQAELTHGQDGALLLIASPSMAAVPLATHFGCRAVEIASLSQPALARHPGGNLKVRASAIASDLAPEGPGSCTYDPTSTTGLILVRRDLNPGLINTLNATGLRP